MYTVLLVDDEKIITRGLSALIDWQKYGFNTIIHAHSAEEALKIVKDKEIHLLITDIRMPNKSGLDLLKEINDIDDKIHKVILSGYDDFKYAQEGIKLAVSDYLLKPVDKNKLEELVAQTVNRLEKDQKSNDKTIHQHFYDYFNFADEPKNEIKEIMLFNNKHTFYLIKADSIQMPTIPDFKKYIYIEKINDDLLLLVVFTPNESEQRTFQEQLFSENKENFRIVYSGMQTKVEVIKQFYQDFKFSWTYYYMDKTKLERTVLFSINDQHDLEISDIFIEEDDMDDEVMALKIEQHLDYLFTTHRDTKNLRLSIVRMFVEFFKKLYIEEKISTSEFEAKMVQLFTILYNVFDYNSLKNVIIKEMINYEQRKDEVIHPTLKRVYQQINFNYDKDLTIQKLADDFNMNPAYLGQLIQTESGAGFNEHLNNYRLSRAFELLNYTNDSVSKIALEVGFNDASYFHKKFKEKYGLTPSQIRSQ